MPPPQAGLETAASAQRPTSPAGFVLPLSFQEQAPQANVSAQKTPNICPSQRPLLPGGAPGQLLGVEKARDKGTEGRRAGVCAGRGRSWDERARTCTPRGARGAGTRQAPSDRSSRGHPRTLPSRRQRRSPPHGRPLNSASARETRNSRDHLPRAPPDPALLSPGPRGPATPSAVQKIPPVTAGGSCPFPLSRLRRGCRGGADIPARHSVRPRPGAGKETNRNSPTFLRGRLGRSLQRRRQRRQHRQVVPARPPGSARRAPRAGSGRSSSREPRGRR